MLVRVNIISVVVAKVLDLLVHVCLFIYACFMVGCSYDSCVESKVLDLLVHVCPSKWFSLLGFSCERSDRFDRPVHPVVLG